MIPKVVYWSHIRCSLLIWRHILTYPSSNPGKLGKTGEKLGISAGALIRPVNEDRINHSTVKQLCLYNRRFNYLLLQYCCYYRYPLISAIDVFLKMAM
jgi:hypothetical protein